MSDRTRRIVRIRLLLLFLIPGLLIFTAVFSIQSNIEKNKANKDICEIIDFMKEQCIRYDNILTNSRVRIQTDLIEKATELKRCMQKGEFSDEELEQYLKEQRLEGILILDKNFKTKQSVYTEEIQDTIWKHAFEEQELSKILKYPNRVITDCIETFDKDSYYYTAMSAGSSGKIIICYENAAVKSDQEDEVSIETILTGYKMESNGIVVLTDGTRVISSNDEVLQGKAIENCPQIMRFNSSWTPEKMVRIKENGEIYYGRHTKCGQYYIYVFLPKAEVFADRSTVMMYTVVFYLAFWFILLELRRRGEKLRAEEQKQQELEYQKQILESAEDARRANMAKTEFLRRMSHDIRTPINGIIGMLNIGDHFPEDMKKQAECRQKIRGASRFLLELVNDVLDMSKMESGNIELEQEPFNVRDVLRDVVSMIEVQAVERGLKFSCERQETAHWNVIGSPVHLRQILMNVAGNAVKYNRENGSLHLSCRELSCDGKNAVFEFACSDTGRGMSQEFQKHMFEPFSQENAGARTTFNGSGLGLSIVKKLVEKMGGQIRVESKEGVGSTFTVTLSLKIDTTADQSENAGLLPEVQDYSIAGIKILLVEDNELNMEIAEFILKNEEAIVRKAWNGQEAVDIFRDSQEGEFDVILMDVMMPVMDGLAASRKIREMNREDAKHIPIIAMTANAFEEDRRRSREAGMNRHLAKPLDAQEIVRTIAECVLKV